MLEYFQYYPDIDLFASRLNAQLVRFFSYRPDPFAEVTNAFLVSWEDENVIVMFHTFAFACIIRQDITKNFCKKSNWIISGANWPTQIWFLFLMDMLISEPFIIPPSINQLELPCNMNR